MNTKELSRFYENVSTLLNSGLTIERGLETIKQGKKSSTLWMIDGLQDYICRGGKLWEAMSRYPKFFDDFQVIITRGAEESGMLVNTFKKLAKYYKTWHREKQRFLAGMIYPLILLHAVIMVPPLKYLVVQSLDRSYWSVILPPLLIAYGIAGVVYVFWQKFYRSGPLRQMVDEVSLCLPVIGKLVRDIALGRAFWSLATMLSAGIDAITAARNAANASGNSVVTRRLLGALYVLEGGRTFKEYFMVSEMITSMQLGIVAVGEESGAMPESMEKMARQMEESNTLRFNMIMKAAAFITYIIAAAIIALTVLSFYKGYFSLI